MDWHRRPFSPAPLPTGAATPALRSWQAGHVSTPSESQTPLATVTVRYWAAARAATGTPQELRPPGTVAAVLRAAAADHPGLDQVVAVASTLLDGVAVGLDTDVPPGSVLEVLPPFAGG